MKESINQQEYQNILNKYSWPNDEVISAISPAHMPGPIPFKETDRYKWALNSFSQIELSNLAEDPQVDLIVHHGDEFAPRDFVRRYGHRELVQPHTAIGAARTRIDRIRLQKILIGEICNWQQLGGKDIPISLYLHGADLNFRALKWQFEENGFTIDTTLKKMPDYQALADAGKIDQGAFIFGLRSEAQFSEWLIKAPICEGVFQPKTISVFMRSSSITAPNLTEQFLKTVYCRLKEDRLVSVDFRTWDARHH